MFGYLIPRSYKEALEFDEENNNTKWADATRDEMDCIKEQQVSQTPKGQMRFKSQENPKCTSQSPENQRKLNICGETQWETQGKACS